MKSKDGYKANQDPVFAAAGQLYRGFLGFVSRRKEELGYLGGQPGQPSRSDFVIPILVTTAELFVCDNPSSKISLKTGNLETELEKSPHPWLILKHPFATIETPGFKDFRRNPNAKADWHHWNQELRESIYVVTSEQLPDFLSETQLGQILDGAF